MKLLNLGCGKRFIAEWTNLDFVKTGEGVVAHNLLKGIPFPSNTFDVVYHSHVLEHFSKNDGQEFIAECYRVLRPNGIIRVAVPDLEQIVRNYISFLEKAKRGNNEAVLNYDWTLLELFDQMIRNENGGTMGKVFKQAQLPNEEFIFSRMGADAKKTRNIYLKLGNKKNIHNKKGILATLKSYLPFYKTYKLGKFRQEGEIHQWMYDQFSLGRLLKGVGFSHPQTMTAHTSHIKNWEKYQFLDVENSVVRKPDSLFMEAIKP